jgi:UDP-GlcNAc:undecaprenyl-phosphate GlcNAc-1-phosphate transferase
MNPSYYYFIYPFVSFLLVLFVTPTFRKLANKIGMVDKPNFRKSHYSPIPVIGGFVIFFAASLTLCINRKLDKEFFELQSLFIGAFIMLIVGIVDDKINVRAIIKLIIQLSLAFFVYSSGIKIESLFGIFGVNELPEFLKFGLTILIITGTVNAFNLTDGIDGLAAGLAIIGFTAFSIIAIMLNKVLLAFVFLTIIGALIGFLKFNLSKKNKIFLGDAGSLFLGYVLVVSGMILIKTSINTSNIAVTLSTVIGVLVLPVIDSIRVYTRRIKRGYSPFRADKTHLHHLLINLKIEHGSASVIIVITTVTLLLLSVFTGSFFSHTVTIISLLILFAAFSNILSLNNEINEWIKKNRELENRKYD